MFSFRKSSSIENANSAPLLLLTPPVLDSIPHPINFQFSFSRLYLLPLICYAIHRLRVALVTTFNIVY